MSFLAMGTIAATVLVTLSPDLSGNFVATGAADEVEINAAIVYCAAIGGGEVALGYGGWTLAATVNVPAGVLLRGMGWTTILNYDAGGNCITFTGDNAKVRDLKIVITAGAGAGGTRPNGIYANARTNLEISNVWCYGDITVADDGADARQCGIVFLAVKSSLVTENKLEYCDRHGMYVEGDWDASYVRILDNDFSYNTRHGAMFLEEYGFMFSNNMCHHNTLSGFYVEEGSESIINDNTCSYNTENGIHLNYFYDNTLIGNICEQNDLNGILSFNAQFSTISCNTAELNGGSGIHGTGHGIYTAYTGNHIADNALHGIFLDPTPNPADVYGVTISGNTINSNAGHGIYIIQHSPSTIVGNNIIENAFHGIYIYDCKSVTVVGNTCYENDEGDTGTYDGICVESDSDDVIIHSNTCSENDRYGINIVDATCDRAWVKNNALRNNTAGAFNDGGTDTKLATIPMPFIQGSTFISADGSAKGWEINAEADMAVALGQLPLEVQQVVRVKIWAVALGAPAGAGGQMHLDVVIQAGADNLAYTTENIALADFDSVTTDYVNTDVVHWSIDSGDDADIADLVGGMSFECKINGAVAAAPDGATNATFRVCMVEVV